jgi:hypothetical protein
MPEKQLLKESTAKPTAPPIESVEESRELKEDQWISRRTVTRVLTRAGGVAAAMTGVALAAGSGPVSGPGLILLGIGAAALGGAIGAWTELRKHLK